MSNTMHKIDNVVWAARAQTQCIEETCPDCLGTARWLCVLPNGEQFGVECPRCYRGGYDPSTGRIRERVEVKAWAEQVTIKGVRAEAGREAEYSTVGGWGFNESDIFTEKAPALARARVRAEEIQEAEHARLNGIAMVKSRSRRWKSYEGRESVADPETPRSIAYARSQVRNGVKEIERWREYARLKGAEIPFPQEPVAPPTPSPEGAPKP